MMLTVPKVQTVTTQLSLYISKSRTVAEKQMIQKTTPEEMSVSKEPPPSTQPSKAAQTGTDKLTVEVTDTTIEKTNSGHTYIIKKRTKFIF